MHDHRVKSLFQQSLKRSVPLFLRTFDVVELGAAALAEWLEARIEAHARNGLSLDQQRLLEGLRRFRADLVALRTPELDATLALWVLSAVRRYLRITGPRRAEDLFRFLSQQAEGRFLSRSTLDQLLKRYVTWGVLQTQVPAGTDWLEYGLTTHEGAPRGRAARDGEAGEIGGLHPLERLAPRLDVPAPHAGEVRASLFPEQLLTLKRTLVRFIEQELDRHVRASQLLPDDPRPALEVEGLVALQAMLHHANGDPAAFALRELEGRRKDELI